MSLEHDINESWKKGRRNKIGNRMQTGKGSYNEDVDRKSSLLPVVQHSRNGWRATEALEIQAGSKSSGLWKTPLVLLMTFKWLYFSNMSLCLLYGEQSGENSLPGMWQWKWAAPMGEFEILQGRSSKESGNSLDVEDDLEKSRKTKYFSSHIFLINIHMFL